MDNLLAIGAVQCLFLICIVTSKKQKAVSDWVLLAILLVWTIRFGLYWMNLQSWRVSLPSLIGIEWTWYLLDGPLLYVYIISLLEPHKLGFFRYWIHFLPFLGALVYAFVSYGYYSEQELQVLFADRLLHPRERELGKLAFEERMFIAGLILSLALYVGLSWDKSRRFARAQAMPLSLELENTLDWIRKILWIWLAFFALPLSLFFLNMSRGWLPIHLTDVPLIFAFLVMLFIPAYYGLRFPKTEDLDPPALAEPSPTFAPGENQAEKTARYEKSGLAADRINFYRGKLEKLMEEEKPYLNPDLNLSSLAASLSLSSNQASQVLNEGLGKNFFDFVNTYRVAEFKKRVREPGARQITLIALAQECGFKSKSSFNAIFKRFTQLTPSEYRRQNESS